MADDNLIYYRKRHAEEIMAARSANSSAAATRHREMAERYAALAGGKIGDDSTQEAPLTEQ